MSEQRDNLITALHNNFGLDDSAAQSVIDYAISLSTPERKANDYALAKYLNDRVLAIFGLVSNYRSNLPDLASINRSYVLLVDELKRLYSRNTELEAIRLPICWHTFDAIDYMDSYTLYEYTDSDNDYGQSHNSKVNRLCIAAGKEVPNISPALQKILDEADVNVLAFIAELDEIEADTVVVPKNWYIPEYVLTYKQDGTLLINNVLKLKKAHAGSGIEKLLEQAIKNPNTLTKIELNTARNLSTILSASGITSSVRDIFFPTVSNSKKKLVFRPAVTHEQVVAENIDTNELDNRLIKAGAIKQPIPVSLADIPF